jgi:hypothetical protein
MFNKYELLAAAQAMLIYFIMRMIEGESKNTDFDLPLLVSLSVCIPLSLVERHPGYSKLSRLSSERWKKRLARKSLETMI